MKERDPGGGGRDEALLPLAAIGGALAVCSDHGELLGATDPAKHLFARLGIASARLPDSLWRPLIASEVGEAIEWRPRGGAAGTLGCTRYGLGADRHLLLMREISALQHEASQRLHQHRVEAAGRLIALVAHDLRAPLASLVLNLDQLSLRWDSMPPPEVRESLRGCNQATEQLRRTIDALLDFARVGPGTPSELQLRDVFERVGAMLHSMLRAGRHVLVVEVDERAAWVRGNPVAIEQIFVNLVLNAAEAATSPIEIGLRSSPAVVASDDGGTREMVRIRVSDTGPGIPAEHRSRLFQGSFSTKIGGAGIGLCLARDATMAGGGRLELEDSAQGACFSVLLPAGAAP